MCGFSNVPVPNWKRCWDSFPALEASSASALRERATFSGKKWSTTTHPRSCKSSECCNCNISDTLSMGQQGQGPLWQPKLPCLRIWCTSYWMQARELEKWNTKVQHDMAVWHPSWTLLQIEKRAAGRVVAKWRSFPELLICITPPFLWWQEVHKLHKFKTRKGRVRYVYTFLQGCLGGVRPCVATKTIHATSEGIPQVNRTNMLLSNDSTSSVITASAQQHFSSVRAYRTSTWWLRRETTKHSNFLRCAHHPHSAICKDLVLCRNLPEFAAWRPHLGKFVHMGCRSVRLPQYCQGQSATTWSWTQRSWTFRLRRACLGHFLGPQLGRQCQTSMIATTEPMDCYQQQDLHMSCHVLHDYVNVENEISKRQTRRCPGKHIDCMRCDRKHRAKSDLVTQLRTVCNVDRTLIRVVVPNASQICTTSSAIFWTDLNCTHGEWSSWIYQHRTTWWKRNAVLRNSSHNATYRIIIA